MLTTIERKHKGSTGKRQGVRCKWLIYKRKEIKSSLIFMSEEGEKRDNLGPVQSSGLIYYYYYCLLHI